MATYTTKFALHDTAYFVDTTSLTILSGRVVDVYIHDVYPATLISYRLVFNEEGKNKTKYAESELFYLEEAKQTLSSILNDRQTEVESLL